MESLEPASFGDLLKALRKHKHVNQQALADKLGVHLNTISKWERGICLPDSKGMVLELAHQLRLDERETRQLLEASLTALSPYWLVPAPRNPFFTGRTALLVVLHQQLQHDQAVAVCQSYAVSGLGGIGKTQLALEYAYQHATEYHAVFWIGAETIETLYASFSTIAEVLGLPERTAQEQQQVVQGVLRWLTTHKGWLLIFDNVEEVLTLKPFLPVARQGAVLITTRLRALEGLAPSLDLAPFSGEEGVRFLLTRAGLLAETAPVPETWRAVAQTLVAALDGLPLALDQAGAYLERHGCTLDDYLHLFRQRQIALLADRPSVAEHPQSVVTTFTLSFEQLTQASPAAAELLRACAFLAPEAIPEELMTQGAAQWGPELSAVVADPDQFNRTLGKALRYSLLQRDGPHHTLALHRLVQAVLRAQLEEARQREWAERVIRLLVAAFPDPQDYVNWAQCQRLLPHALVCATWMDHWQFAFFEAGALLNQIGRYLYERGQYVEAVPLAQQMLAIRERVLGPNHPDVARGLNNLASLYHAQGRDQEALPLFQRALIILELALGPAHPLVALNLNNLANVYRVQGQYAEAVPLTRRALAIWEQALGPSHPDVARSLNILALLYHAQGQDQAALPLAQRALTIREQALGSGHSLVAHCLNTLALLYHAQGQYQEALLLAQRALAIWEQALGPIHPDVANGLNTLALLYHAQGQDQEALPLVQRALAIWEQALGSDHPTIATGLELEAELRRALGQPDLATARTQAIGARPADIG